MAVDGLSIQVHEATNVLLRWPSTPGQTFVVVHTKSLSAPVQWEVLASGYPAEAVSNETTFVHYDQIPAATGGGGQSMMSLNTASSELSELLADPMLFLPGVQDDPVPAQIFPPGFDLTAYNILWPDGSTELWNSKSLESYAATQSELLGYSTSSGLPTFDSEGEESSGDALGTLGCGFYRVLGVRVVAGLTNNTTLSGYFAAAARPDSGVQYLRLLVDGEGFPGLDAIAPPFTNTPVFEWIDSARKANGGPYNLQVEAVYQINPVQSSGLHHALSEPFQVSVFNELSFPAWSDWTEDEVCPFDVVSAHPVVDWEIDVYNVYDYIDWLNGVITDIWPIHIKTGSTTNGIIQYDWDFMDDYGVMRTNIWNDPWFVSFTYTSWGSQAASSGEGPQEAGGSAATMNPLTQQPPKWPLQGHWVVAWQDMFRDYYDQNDYLKTAFTNLLIMANLPESDVPAAPPFWRPFNGGGTNAQTFPMRYDYPQGHHLADTTGDLGQAVIYDENLLRQFLLDPRARNFFYSGHGSPQLLGSVVLYASLLKSYGMQRYRFVWLDGCETAGGDWDKTFGINGPGLFTLDYYRERTKRPALFVGNKYSVPKGIFGAVAPGGVPYDGTIPRSQSEFYNQFIFFWQTLGREYKDAIQLSKNLVQASYPNPVMHYEDGAKQGQVYWPGDDQGRVGYEGMRFNQFNKYYDIPRP